MVRTVLCRPPSKAPEALERDSVIVSAPSAVVSSRTWTANVLLISPAAKESVPETALKSAPAVAVPPDTA
jgi:hypothetical protein